MSTPLLEQVHAALATVNDPEIKRPITDIGMVESVEVDGPGVVRLTVLLTVAGCPMKDTITRDVNAAVRAVPGVTDVDLTLGVMCAEQRAGLKDLLSDGKAQRDIHLRPARLADQGVRDRLRQGRRRQVVGHGQPRAGDGRPGAQGRSRRRRHLRPLGARDARCRGRQAHPGRRPDHAGAHRVRRLGDLDRDAQAAARPGGRLARADARPGAGPDARRRLLGRPRRPAPRPAARHRRRRDLPGPAPARRRGRRGHDPAGGRRRGGRARRHDGLDDAPARRRRRREHVLPALPALHRGG